MDAIKEKFLNLYVDSLSDEEQRAEFGITRQDFVVNELKTIKQIRFKALAQLNKAKAETMLSNLKDQLVAAIGQSVSLQELLVQRYPAVQFRNLDKLSEADLKQLSEDMELINMIEEIEDEQGPGKSGRAAL